MMKGPRKQEHERPPESGGSLPAERFMRALADAQDRQRQAEARRQRRQDAITQERAQGALKAFQREFNAWFGKDTVPLIPESVIEPDAAGMSAHLRFSINGCAGALLWDASKARWLVRAGDRPPIPVPLGEFYVHRTQERVDILLVTIAQVLGLSDAAPCACGDESERAA